MAFNFNAEIVNSGLSDVYVDGASFVSYYYGEKDTCLDLMASAKYRKPLVIHYGEDFSLSDYGGFTVSLWVQKAANDAEEYCILSQQEFYKDRLLGWELKAEACGSWSWEFKDSLQSWSYVPTLSNQPINDGQWHHLAFSYDKNAKESRLYFDGKNVAVYSMSENSFEIESIPIRIGISPVSSSEAMDIFNGRIDDLSIWSRPLISEELQQVHSVRSKHKFDEPEVKDNIKVMTWDIWQGGMHEGKHVGKKRILDIIKSSGADIVMLQEMAGTGPYIADGLDYYYYQRTENLGMLSRFPLMESKNVYRPNNAACIKVNLGKGKYIYACPVALSQQPRMDAYFKSEYADPDSIFVREMEGRGKEITFILGELRHLLNTNENTPIILGGGMYSGSHLDWTQKNESKNLGLVIEFPVSKQVERAGFKDSYRFLHPDETKNYGHTWSPKFKSAFPNRTDFIYYIGEHIYPVESYVIDDHLVSFPSSHAAVVSVFDLNKN